MLLYSITYIYISIIIILYYISYIVYIINYILIIYMTFIFFSITVYQRMLSIVPCWKYTRILPFIHLMCDSLYLLTLGSQFFPSLAPCRLAIAWLFSACMSLSVSQRSSSVSHFRSHIWVILSFSVRLSSLSMVFSRSIHAAGNGIISFCSMAE